MPLTSRLAIAALILAVDLGTVFVPIAACYLAWVIVRRPPSFLGFVLKLYGEEGGRVARR